MAERRKEISKKMRFEVFKRDNFTCQYCGRKAPDVVLNVDHINPVSKGGNNDILNLITSCFECNNGKRDIPLDKKEELGKQRESLEMLNERRKQIDMMIEWKEEMNDIKEYKTDRVECYMQTNFGWNLTETGRRKIMREIEKFGMEEVIDAIDIAYEKYRDSECFLEMVGRICTNRRIQQAHPEYKDIYYLSKIGEKNICTYKKSLVINFLKRYYNEHDYDEMRYIFCKTFTWCDLVEALTSYYGVESL